MTRISGDDRIEKSKKIQKHSKRCPEHVAYGSVGGVALMQLCIFGIGHRQQAMMEALCLGSR